MARLDPEVVRLLESPTHPERSMLEWAQYWAEQGWPVFPLRPNGKEPLFPNPHPKGPRERGECSGQCGLVGHGVNDATRDPEMIAKWWGQNPTAGIGGSALARLIFDSDYQHGARRLDVLPPTRQHLSGRGNGNAHAVYGIAQQVKAGTHVLGDGVDISAGAGSYVVLPPSTHPESGKPYTIADETVPEYALVAAPIVGTAVGTWIGTP